METLDKSKINISTHGRNEAALLLVLVFLFQVGIFALINIIWPGTDMEGFAIFCIAVNSVFVCLWGYRETEDQTQLTIFLTGYFIRIFLLFVDLYIIRIMHSGGDTEGFYNAAARGQNFSWNGKYVTWLMILFKMTGPIRIWAQYLNLILSMGTCVIVLKSMRLLHINETAKHVGFAAVCLLPNWLCLSVILVRESIMAFFVAMSIYMFLRWFREGNTIYALAAMLLVIPAIHLHGGVVSVVIAYICGYIAYNARKSTTRITIVTAGVLLAAAICIWEAVSYLNIPYLGDISLQVVVHSATVWSRLADEVGSMYLKGMLPSTWIGVVLQTPIRMLYFFFSPLPWDWRGLQDMIAFLVSGLPYIFVFYNAILSLCNNKKHKNLLMFLLLSILLFGTVHAWGTVAAGTAMRHREKIMPIYALILALSIDARAKRYIASAVPGKLVDTLSKNNIL